MHSHLVPAVDDGSDSIETSIALLQGLSALGYRKVITTPHIRPDYFPNTKETILAGFADLQAAAKSAGLEMELACAAEYFVDYDFQATVEKEELLTFSGNHILMEISTFSPPPNLYESIFKLRIKGYEPIIAHPERYVYYEVSEFQKLKDFGCLLQMNILSLSGHYGKPVKDLANKLLKAGMIDLLGTDLHHQRHLESLQKAAHNDSMMDILATREFRNADL
ncbi:MAG: histidinol phosphatase [Lewinellaceae bacterium]|nr:hypothetical protein [Saprospiraceae bacterium]MCB9338328.1 histidinol phosphatase [Lewinellaceae bacterium]